MDGFLKIRLPKILLYTKLITYAIFKPNIAYVLYNEENHLNNLAKHHTNP